MHVTRPASERFERLVSNPACTHKLDLSEALIICIYNQLPNNLFLLILRIVCRLSPCLNETVKVQRKIIKLLAVP